MFHQNTRYIGAHSSFGSFFLKLIFKLIMWIYTPITCIIETYCHCTILHDDVRALQIICEAFHIAMGLSWSVYPNGSRANTFPFSWQTPLISSSNNTACHGVGEFWTALRGCKAILVTNTVGPRQNGRHFSEGTFKHISQVNTSLFLLLNYNFTETFFLWPNQY